MPQRRYRRYYEALGVPEGATIDEVRRAYRRRTREVHPDLHPGDPQAEQRQRELNEAYGELRAHLSAGAEASPAEPPPVRQPTAPSWPWPGRASAPLDPMPPWAPFGLGVTATPPSWRYAESRPGYAAGRPGSLVEALLRGLERDLGGWSPRHWTDDLLDEALDALFDLAWHRWRMGL
jgi:curved DNA-binding protein CbpA